MAILGAGAAGLATAIRLQDVGLDDVVIYEKSDGVGGTWRDNTYPGAACDVPSHLYSFSFAPKTDWTRKFARQPEILSYFEGLVRSHGLEPMLRLGTEITSVTWDEDRVFWVLVDAAGGVETADVVVSGLGQLNRPNIPDIAGLDSFSGPSFHSARWRHDIDLRGLRVRVIGIGASAIQFVPRVARDARTTTLFQRSVNYVAPKPDRAFRRWERWLLERVPVLQRGDRSWIYWRLEPRFALMRRNSRMGAWLREKFSTQVAKMASDDLPAEALVPDYDPGCRRILIANDWYPTLLRPDVEVVTDAVSSVTPTGVVTADGTEHRLDALIFGTGFHSTEFLSPIRVTGRDGRTLDDAWRDGAEAYLGLAVPGFPNLFVLYGPNTNLGHNSILFMIEQQVDFVRSVIAEMMERDAAATEVEESAMRRYRDEMADALDDTVWSEDCSSWYKNSAGRITNNWPDFSINYRRRLRHRRHDDLRFTPRAG